MFRPVIAAIAGAALIGLPLSATAQQAPTRSIVNLTGQLYRAQNNNHYTVYLVTPEGVIMSDPINRDFARWLKSEIATRHKVPVRYVLYTHHDWDHHDGIFTRFKKQGRQLDHVVAALINDLDERGLLETTLVLVMGEFGRTPTISTLADRGTPGRDHWSNAISILAAGCGTPRGIATRTTLPRSNSAIVSCLRARNRRGEYSERSPVSRAALLARRHVRTRPDLGIELRELRLGDQRQAIESLPGVVRQRAAQRPDLMRLRTGEGIAGGGPRAPAATSLGQRRVIERKQHVGDVAHPLVGGSSGGWTPSMWPSR